MTGHQDPPVIKNQPPIAGSIAWERSLFQRMKHTIIRFQSMEEMLITDEGKEVRSSCDKLTYFIYIFNVSDFLSTFNSNEFPFSKIDNNNKLNLQFKIPALI